MTQFIDTLVGIFQSSGFARFGEPGGYLYAIMICVGCFLLYLAIVKEFEPLILLPMAFGMILANLPGSGVMQKWVDYANKVGAIILYDAAYEAYISEKDIPHSIYECEGARTCAIEMRSFSKNAGFTGMRLGFTVIPKDIKSGDVTLHSLWARRHGTKYNGAPYIIQRAGEAVYSPEGKAQLCIATVVFSQYTAFRRFCPLWAALPLTLLI